MKRIVYRFRISFVATSYQDTDLFYHVSHSAALVIPKSPRLPHDQDDSSALIDLPAAKLWKWCISSKTDVRTWWRTESNSTNKKPKYQLGFCIIDNPKAALQTLLLLWPFMTFIEWTEIYTIFYLSQCSGSFFTCQDSWDAPHYPLASIQEAYMDIFHSVFVPVLTTACTASFMLATRNWQRSGWCQNFSFV